MANVATHSSTNTPTGQMRDQTNGYLPIENYGLIGNMRTCALVGMDGSVDFMCWQVDKPYPSHFRHVRRSNPVPGLTSTPRLCSAASWTRTREGTSAYTRSRT